MNSILTKLLNEPVFLDIFKASRHVKRYNDPLDDLYNEVLCKVTRQYTKPLMDIEVEHWDPEGRILVHWEDAPADFGVDSYIHVSDFKSIHETLKPLLSKHFPKEVDIDLYLFWRFCTNRTTRYSFLGSDLVKNTDICNIDISLFFSKTKYFKLLQFFELLFKAFKKGQVFVRIKAQEETQGWYVNNDTQYIAVIDFYLLRMLETGFCSKIIG
jgi:hypothetical protein